jgi:hypothetical protein
MPSTTGEFELVTWNEEPYDQLDNGGKLTRATVTQNFTGGLSGTGSVVWLMCYQADGTARFVGLQRIDGTLDGRSGSFVAETSGDFDGGEASGRWTILPGSGTGELADIRGDGKFRAPRGPKAEVEFDYSL